MIRSITFVGTQSEASLAIIPAGPAGPAGPIPAHGWSGTELRFQMPNLSWGDYVDLRGPAPEHGWSGTQLRFRQPGGSWGTYVDLKGATGDAATIAAGTVTIGDYDEAAAVTNSGDANAAVFDFTLPAAPAVEMQTSETHVQWRLQGGEGWANLVALADITGGQGDEGEHGWTPALAVVEDGGRRVLQVADWFGGEGTKPDTGDYVGDDGLVSDIEDAVDIRGAQGDPGAGSMEGPVSSTDGMFAVWDGTDGQKLKDSAYGPSNVYTKGEVDTALDCYLPLSGGTLAGPLSLHGDPSSNLHPATKQYVDGLLANVGRRDRVRAATTANITIATALNNGDVLDGVTLATGDLVLVKNQSAAAANGIYVVGASPARAATFDSWDEFPSSLVGVAEGTANADTLWLCVSNDGGTLGSTAINWTQLRVAGELLAANNLSDVAHAGTALANLGGASNTHSHTVSDLPIASQAEAEAGTSTTKLMTPQRTAQAITAALSGGVPSAGDIGSYVVAGTSALGTDASLDVGATVSGASLYVAAVAPSGGLATPLSATASGTLYINITTTPTSLGYSGTWRACARLTRGSTATNFYPIGLFVRIA